MYLSLLGLASGCFKVDDFDKPHAHETFQGNMDLRFGIDNITAGANAINFAIFKTDPSGKRVVLGQIPNANFELMPKAQFEAIRDNITKTVGAKDTLLYNMIEEIDIPGASFKDKAKVITTPDFAGLECDVIDKHTLEVVGFDRSNETLKILECGARGTIYRDGDIIYTTKTIEIFCPMQPMIDFFGKQSLSFVIRERDGVKLADIEDLDEFVWWYIDIHMPQALSIGT